jgi:hypothetical protein
MKSLTAAFVISLLSMSGPSFAQLPGHPLPAPWQQADIGEVGIAGSATEGSDADLFISGAGSDIWGSADSFHYVYQQIEDGDISSNAMSLENTHPFAKIGLMFRLGLDPRAPEVILDMKPDHTWEFMTRQAFGGPTTFIAGLNPGTFGGYPYLSRHNGVITATVCSNACQILGSTPFPTGVGYVGVAITSHDPSALNHGGTAASLPRVATVPQPWFSFDVGNVGLRGSAFFQNNVFTVNGAGADIWGTSDSYHVVDQTFSGDGQIVARISSINAGNTFAKGGVVITDNFGPTVILDMRPNRVLEFMARPARGAEMNFVAGTAVPSPIEPWLKLTRTGNTFTGYWSEDGSNWNLVGTTSVSMPTSVAGGLAVTSHDVNAINMTTFDHVTLSSNAFQDIDIGDTGAQGGSGFNDEGPLVYGAGADIWGAADSFNYYYGSLVNDGRLYTRVSSLTNTSPFAKAGIMIRASTDPSSAHVILDVKPDGGIEFMARTATGAQTTYIAGVPRSFPVNLILERSGSTVTGYVIDGTQSTQVGSISIDLPSEALIGIAVTSHVRGTTTTAFFDTISR